MKWFFESNEPSARLLRTIVQACIGVLIGYLTAIAPMMPDIVAMLVIPLVMAVLSPIMAEIGKHLEDEHDDPHYKVGGTDGDD